ncbi:COMM domain-containing protein 8-like [Panonychus citri]|uniref:COMM domain-containing protein 8-like n=1 Tax=Panonychus citri TaxID=50023 RepID=UPI002307C2B2|nr:COMM domain-containing protein 8-like [Panonychus citri]
MRSPSIEVILKVVHQLIDDQCGRDGPIKDNYVPDHWSDENEFNSFTSTIKQLINQNIDYKHGQTIKVQGDLPEEVNKSILEAIELRRQEIKSNLIGKILSSPINLPLKKVLKDFDWQVKLILSSNLLSEINESLINLDLLLIKSNYQNFNDNSDNQEIISIEMDKCEIRQLIEKLEELMDNLDR